jgi:hypothetical protein
MALKKKGAPRKHVLSSSEDDDDAQAILNIDAYSRAEISLGLMIDWDRSVQELVAFWRTFHIVRQVDCSRPLLAWFRKLYVFCFTLQQCLLRDSAGEGTEASR